jgi:hypothetical protein
MDQVANEVYDGVAAGRSLHVDDDRPGSLFVAILAHVTSHGNNRDLVKPTGGGV